MSLEETGSRRENEKTSIVLDWWHSRHAIGESESAENSRSLSRSNLVDIRLVRAGYLWLNYIVTCRLHPQIHEY